MRSFPLLLLPNVRRAPAFVPALILALILAGCGGKKEESRAPAKPRFDEAMASLISGFSGGMIPADGPLKVVLVNPVADTSQINKPLKDSPLEISPLVKGVAVWVDGRTLEFRPAKGFERGRTYSAALRLDRLMTVPEGLKTFVFQFSALNQQYETEVGALESMDAKNPEWLALGGRVRLADRGEPADVERMLEATLDGKPVKVRWEHGADGREHPFRVDSLRRVEDSAHLVLRWDGRPVGVERAGADTLLIPSVDMFRVLGVEAAAGEERYVSVRFSDPLQPGQDFRGLVEVPEQGGLRFQARGNELRVYSGQSWAGARTVRVSQGVRNASGRLLQNPGTWTVAFEETRPGVRFAGKGVIIPGAGDLHLPFEAVNLRSVRVSVTRIYPGNVPQFLQVNDLGGGHELRRVGRIVLSKVVPLDPAAATRSRWARYAVDLGELARKEARPGAVYRVNLSFRRSNSTYPCADSAAPEEDRGLQDWDEDLDVQASGWDGIDEFYVEGGWNWADREDPCKPSYYRHRDAGRNVISSDIGLMAKMGSPDGRTAVLHVAATRLLTAAPLENADLEVLNFQHQTIAQGRTDGNGFAEIALEGRPFLLKAAKGEQAGYLKLDDPSALQMGRFDVGGTAVQEGLKGYLFGERGVWRPGDSLYLTFILEDRKGRLPAGHPVTFELRNPQGQLVRALTRSSGGGFYSFATATDPDAPTGNWTARVKAGPAVFEEKLKIETVVPNRLRIRAAFSPSPLRKGEPVQGRLDVSWLSGAVARNLEAEVELTLAAAEPGFKTFTDYAFSDPARRFRPETQKLFEGRLDAGGRASFSRMVEVSALAPGALRADFRTRVLEAGGGSSVDRFSEPFHPYNVYLGVKLPPGDRARGMLLTDTTHPVRLVALDPAGRKLDARKVRITLSKLDWRWWWEQDGQDAHYMSDQGRNVLQEDTVTLSGGEGAWGLKIRYPDWGRYMVRACDLGESGTLRSGGHCTGKIFYMDWPGWAGRAGREGGGGAAILAFSSDKPRYVVGEKVRVTIPGTEGGRALVSLEKGGSLLKRYWIDLEGGETVHEFEAESGMAPNIYLYVALVQPHARAGGAANDLPIRMYNVIPIHVEDPSTRLMPRIGVEPAVFRPGEKAVISVSEGRGRGMHYVVAAVDEGLLDLTRFPTPDPHGRFYAREALGMKTWDLFDYVAGAYGSRLERILSIGGDGEAVKAPDGRKGNRFPPMVRFLGPFTLDKGKTARHAIDIPQYVGSVRVMVVAGRDGAYGNAEKAVPVRKPVMVLGVLPRVLAPGGEVELPISVFAMEDRVKEVGVEVSATGPVRVRGGRTKRVSFREPSDELVTFGLETSQETGWAKVSIRARSGGESAVQTLEIEVRNPNSRVTEAVPAYIPPGGAWSHAFLPPGAAGSNRAVLELSRMPPLDLGKRLGYLVRYPHGCVEQVTSGAFPQLYLDALVDLPQAYRGEVERNVKSAILRLRAHQAAAGGFGFWPGEQSPNDWASSYAGHFLVEAGRKGYALPEGMIDQWKRYQRTQARAWRDAGDYHGQLAQAYRLYTLALAGAPEIGAMNRLKEAGKLALPARWQLGGAYQLAGQAEAAADLVQGDPGTVKPYAEFDGTFGSDLRDKGMMLEVLSLMDRKAEALPLMREVAAGLARPEPWSTQTTAFALIGVARYAGRHFDRGEAAAYAFRLNGAGQDGRFQAPLHQQTLAVIDGRENRLEIRNPGREPLHARLILEGVPPLGGEKAASHGVELEVRYKTLKGEALDPSRLAQGQDFVAEYSVRNPGNRGALRQLALTSVFPSGWEIRNTRLDPVAAAAGRTGEPGTRPWWSPPDGMDALFEYQDFRDDRVHTYFHLQPGEEKIFRFFLNAAYLGRFRRPQSMVEAMYNPGVHARTAGGEALVSPAGGGAAAGAGDGE